MNIHEITPTHTFVYRGIVVDEYVLDQGHTLSIFLMSQSKKNFSVHSFNPKFRVKVIWLKHEETYPEDGRVPMFYTDADPDDPASMKSARTSVGKMLAEHYQLYLTGTLPAIDPSHS